MTVPMIKSIGDVPYPIDTHSDAFSPLLTAGAALGITGNDAEESAWLARTSEADGVASVRSIHGRTIRWNQLVGEPVSYGSTTASGLTVTTAENGVFVVDGTCSSHVWLASIRARPIGSLVSGHKYIISAKGDIASFSQLGTSNQGYPTGGKNYVMFTASRDYGAALFQAYIPEGTYSNAKFIAQCFDLTAMFSAGSEPSTVAEFTALYPLPYYPYDAGSLLPVQMEGFESEDANGDPLQTRTIPAGTLRSAGTVYDEQTASERITRVGERAYQSGDESDPTVTTDGTITYYPLATPTTTPIDPPLNMTYRTAAGGTERVMVPTGENSAPPTIVAAQGYTAESLRDAALSAIAPVENGLASTNYGVGSYLVHGGQLCKVTTAIATGESISIGTNVTATTVMAEVLALVQ